MDTVNDNEHAHRDELPGTPVSLWIATTPETNFPALEDDVAVDVAVLGGGIAGITTAFLLKQAGATVAVVEADRVVKSVTGNTTAKVTSLHSLIYEDLIKQFGTESAQIYADAQQAAIGKLAALVEENGIDCDFRRTDAYTYTESEDYLKKITAEVEAATKLGLPVSYVEETTLPFKIKGAIRMTNQAQFHPRKYLLKLVEQIPGDGSYVFEQTRAAEVEDEKPCRVKMENGRTITAQSVVIASHFPVIDPNIYFAMMYQKRSYVLGCRLSGATPEGMFISADEPFHSFRSNPAEDGGQIWMVGGEHHKAGEGGDTEQRYKRLEHYARERFDVSEIKYRWSTQDNNTADGVPYIGKLSAGSKNLYVATGFGGWGMTNSHVAAIILTDLITGKENPWATLFAPSRFKPITSAKTLVKENIKVAKHFVADRFGAEEIEGASEMGAGEGRIVEWRDEKVALYKDEQSALHAVSPVCTHMSCIVDWNSAEKSWDCPCHGSRFNFDGQVIQGPANKDLEPVELKSKKDAEG